jgi:hypothetical protein
VDPATHYRMRTAHTNHTHTCTCGRTVRGNGGWASHRWACPIYQARLEARIVERGTIPVGEENIRRAPNWVHRNGRWEKCAP